MTVGARPPSVAYLNELDGLVVAGMGTGSISDQVLEHLSKFTTKVGSHIQS